MCFHYPFLAYYVVNMKRTKANIVPINIYLLLKEIFSSRENNVKNIDT
tara:strand:- start:1034 stop:1177 length:144 start_codon:yes stop_codon:yes gene_type:complete